MNTRFAFRFLRFALGLVLLCCLVLGDVSPASAALRCYVKADANGLNNGSSWAHAYRSLQSALGSSPCTKVWVAAGTYKPSSSDRAISFQLKNGVAIYGGFDGSETLLSQRDPIANPTILSGEIGVSGNSDNSYHVVVGSFTNSTALLDGFIIMAGNANGSASANDRGGGMYSNAGSPSLKNIIFSGNSATLGGAMVNYSGSSPSLTNVTFSGNSAASGGGGMYNGYKSNPRLVNVTFSGNSAIYAGGMDNDNSSPSLVNVTFSGNSATNVGGAMYNWHGVSGLTNISLTNVTFSGNSAATYYGGGMYNMGGSPRLMNVTFSGNSAPSGGGMYNSGSNPVIKNSILYGDSGGEIDGPATVTYSVVQGGYAGTGNLDADPLLGSLGNNGGFTQTMALGFGSPAIDSGTNTKCPAKDQRGIARPQGPRCDMGAYEYPQTKVSFLSAGAQDGWILESKETSGVGGTMNASQATFALGDDATDRQGRSILSFDTSGLPDDGVITSVMLKIRFAGVVGTNPFMTHGKLLVDVCQGAFSDNASLQLEDFQAVAHKNGALTIKNNPVGGWYFGKMAAINFMYINKGDVTQFRLRFAKDDNDDMSLDYIKFYSGNSTTANRPQLIIQYYTP